MGQEIEDNVLCYTISIYLMIAKFAPWFRSEKEYDQPPLSYRSWRKKKEKRYLFGWSSDLFDRIEETDWDLVIILDACRYDYLSQIASSVVVERSISPVCNTGDFVKKAKETNVFRGSKYISVNPRPGEIKPGDVDVIPVWEEKSWDLNLRTRPPAPVYEKAAKYLNEGEKVVAHTMQPHYPHVCELNGDIRPVPGGLHPEHLGYNFVDDGIVFQTALCREINNKHDFDRVRQSYVACAEFAWNKAKDFAIKMASNGNHVVITADHGELLGEWGLVSHPGDIGLKSLIEVPWVEITPPRDSVETEDYSRTDILRDLGYKD